MLRLGQGARGQSSATNTVHGMISTNSTNGKNALAVITIVKENGRIVGMSFAVEGETVHTLLFIY